VKSSSTEKEWAVHICSEHGSQEAGGVYQMFQLGTSLLTRRVEILSQTSNHSPYKLRGVSFLHIRYKAASSIYTGKAQDCKQPFLQIS